MVRPVLWNKAPYFHPLGKTPPTCLTGSLAPEQNAQALLLGCGDPRSILNTIHTDLGSAQRKLDFTCCENDPAILARNIILLAMISDGISSAICWRVFYHIYLDDAASELLATQCGKLIGMSTNVETWSKSTYGSFIRFSTASTLSQVRKLWKNYMETFKLPQVASASLKSSFASGMKKVSSDLPPVDITTAAAAGPLLSPRSLDAGSKVFTQYWSQGVTNARSFKTPASPHLNPLFVCSIVGQTFNVHRSTNPIAGFHLSSTLAKAQSQQTLMPEDLVEAAFDQFSSWCKSFCKRLSSAQEPSISVRFFAGDPLAFCEALLTGRTQGSLQTKVHTSPSSVSPIILSEIEYGTTAAPLTFNVIDTSDLTDHHGLLNVLLKTAPLLQRTPWSILQTSTFTSGSAKPALAEQLCGDVSTMSILLGVAPASHLSHFNTSSLKDEERFSVWMPKQIQYFHHSVSWRFPSAVALQKSISSSELDKEAALLSYDEGRLAELLFNVYENMFYRESISNHLQHTSLAMYNRQDFVHYNRGSFVSFLSYLRTRVHLDWEKMMDQLIKRIESDHDLMANQPSYQDLTAQLYLNKLYSTESLRQNLTNDPVSLNVFNGWKEVPPVVSVVLKVPRSSLRPLDKLRREDMGTPVMLCQTRGINRMTGPVVNLHASIHACFGTMFVTGEHEKTRASIVEDEDGWEGSSPLLVSFDAPSSLFTKEGNMTTISLNFNTAQPTSLAKLSKTLGVDLKIFSTSVADKAHVTFSCYRPNSSIETISSGRATNTKGEKRLARVNLDNNVAASLVVREAVDFKGVSDDVMMKTEQIADSSVLVSYQDFKTVVRFPYPLEAASTKARFDHRSSCIEVRGSIRKDFEDTVQTKLSLNPFPMARTLTGYNLLNIHYLNLNVLPSIDIPHQSNLGSLKWLATHVNHMFSSPEKRSKHAALLPKLKETITNIIYNWTGLVNPLARGMTLGLSCRQNGMGVYMLIFVNALRLDLSSNTVVIDACVVPLTKETSGRALEAIKKSKRIGLSELTTSEDEMKAWYSLLPAFAERCRMWEHRDGCAHLKADSSITNPLCTCGSGRNLGAFGKVEGWSSILNDATRVAISPLFSFSPLSVEPLSKESDSCAKCQGGSSELLLCVRCQKERYCSQQCQVAHWRQHKPHCGQ